MTEYNEYSIFALIGSMTQAMRAERALACAGLRSEVVKATPSEYRRGCAYGILFSSAEERIAAEILRNARVRFRFFRRGGSG